MPTAIQPGLALVNRMKRTHLQYQQKKVVLISHAKRESIEGIYYLRKAGHSYDSIADIDEIVKSAIQSTIDKIRRLDRLYQSIQKIESVKVNKRSQRLFTKTMYHPLVTYDGLRLELRKVDVEACRQTVISSLKRMEYVSYIAAHKPAMDKWAHEEKDSLGP